MSVTLLSSCAAGTGESYEADEASLAVAQAAALDQQRRASSALEVAGLRETLLKSQADAAEAAQSAEAARRKAQETAVLIQEAEVLRSSFEALRQTLGLRNAQMAMLQHDGLRHMAPENAMLKDMLKSELTETKRIEQEAQRLRLAKLTAEADLTGLQAQDAARQPGLVAAIPRVEASALATGTMEEAIEEAAAATAIAEQDVTGLQKACGDCQEAARGLEEKLCQATRAENDAHNRLRRWQIDYSAQQDRLDNLVEGAALLGKQAGKLDHAAVMILAVTIAAMLLCLIKLCI